MTDWRERMSDEEAARLEFAGQGTTHIPQIDFRRWTPKRSRLPDSAAARKELPLATGLIDYFPDALIAVAGLSRIGNEQHNPGKPLFWDRSMSGDESDALLRHFIDRGTVDRDGVRHSAKVAWRALALLQKEIEAERKH